MRERLASEVWEFECRFWPVDAPERVSYGQLKNSPEEGISAHLMDTPIAEYEGVDSYGPVHGESLSGVPFSLLDAWVVHRRRLTGLRQGNTVDLRAHALVEGAHVTSEEEIMVHGAGARVHRLLDLVTGGTVDTALLDVSPERDSHDSFDVEVDGVAISLNVGTNESYGRRKQSAELIAGAAFGLDAPLNLAEFQDTWLDPLCDLVSFSTAEPAFVESLRIQTMPHDQESPRSAIESEVWVTRRVRPRADEGPYSAYALVLNLATVPDPVAVVRAWYALRERLGSVWPFYFSTLQYRFLPLENQLLNLTAFAEGYHRTLHDDPPLSPEEEADARQRVLDVLSDQRLRQVYLAPLTYANSQSQRQRVRWLADRALAALDAWELDAKQFTNELVDTRNWLVHFGAKGKHACEGEQQAYLRIKLEIILAVNLLRDLGLDEHDAASQIESGMRLRIFPD